MKFLQKILNAPRITMAVTQIERSWDLLANNQVQEAAQLFEKGAQHLKRLPYEYLIMEGFIKFRQNQFVECAKSMEKAIREITSDTDLSEADTKYLLYYICSILSFCSSLHGVFENKICEKHKSPPPIDQVTKHLLKRFPSREHPQWTI